MKNVWITICVAAIFVSSIGCSSIRSTLLTRNEHNTGWCRVPHLKGVPVTVKVPTHLKVTIKEMHFIAGSTIDKVNNYEYVKLPTPIRDVSTDIIKTDKVFTVDFKRPAAGTMKLNLDLDAKEQYFTKIAHEVEDKTLDAVGDLIGDLGGVGFGLASEGSADPNKDLRQVTSVVAVQIFEIDDPNLELNVVDFLNCHLNKSHDAFTVPPGVDTINRVGIQQGLGVETPLCNGGQASPYLIGEVNCSSGTCGR
jgi:hypothetical protein